LLDQLLGTNYKSEVTMKTEHVNSNATTLGPFLKLMLTLAEHRTQTENQPSCGATATMPLPVKAISAAMEEVANHQQPVRSGPIVLGPFLTMVLTLAERKTHGYEPWLRSSIMPASPR